jgi:hypothetical protein
MPMTADHRRLIMQPMTTRAIQAESKPKHEGEEQEPEHEVLRGCERRPHAASVTSKSVTGSNLLPGYRGR